MLTLKRPGTGMCPSKIGETIGKKAIVRIGEDTQIEFKKLS